MLRHSGGTASLMGVDETAFSPWDATAIQEHADVFKSQLVAVLDDLEDPRRLDDWMFLPQ